MVFPEHTVSLCSSELQKMLNHFVEDIFLDNNFEVYLLLLHYVEVLQ